MALAHFRMLNNELFNKDPYLVPEQAPLVILGGKSAICVAKTVNDTKHTRHISIIMNSVRNCEE